MTAHDAPTPSKPRPLRSLLASAQRLNGRDIGGNRQKLVKAESWQDDAWNGYDLVGELRFIATTLAGRVSQARLYVGTVPNSPTDDPEPTEDETAQAVLDSIGGGASGRAQIVYRLAINLFVPGDGWLVGIPRRLLPDQATNGDSVRPRALPITSPLPEQGPEDTGSGIDLTDLEWRMLSVSEVSTQAGKVALSLDQNEPLIVDPDDIWLIRVWRPHPRKWWEADSPTRSSLSVLRELIGMTMHIGAQVDSRLAGAGLLIIAESAARAIKTAAGLPEDDDSDPFTEALLEAMVTPISDRSAASAVVPLVITVPDDAVDKIKHLTFSTPLDAEARELRDEAIRRLALGLDAPPELLLGVSEMSHWGAWLVREDVVTTHIEPPLALICDALTTQFLRPVLLDQGYGQDEVDKLAVWYDVDHMIARPNRGTDALNLYDRDELTGEALRNAVGFDNTDAPPADKLDPAHALALELVRADPSLINSPGLPSVVSQIERVMTGARSDGAGEAPVATSPAEPEDGGVSGSREVPVERVEPGPPETENDDASPEAAPAMAASRHEKWQTIEAVDSIVSPPYVRVPATHDTTAAEVDRQP